MEAVQVLHVVPSVLQSVKGIQKVVVVQALHVVLNVRQSVKAKRHKDVQIARHNVLDHVIQRAKPVVAGNVIGHVVALATNSAKDIV